MPKAPSSSLEFWREAVRLLTNRTRIWADLVIGDGERIGRKRVERLMRQAGLSGLITKKWKATAVRVSLSFGQARPQGRDRAVDGQPWRLLHAVAESFFTTLKKELIHPRSWSTRAELRTEVFDYIETF